jgi:glycosyltransferase involved in cell wall biosynthesis
VQSHTLRPVSSPPSLSVIVPVYDGARTIAESLETVLAQTPPDTEVLVIDDGSTDDTVAVVESFGYLVHLVRQLHAGSAAAFNRGMTLARGACIASVDAGDRWLPQKLEHQMAALQADPEIGAVFGFERAFRAPDGAVRAPDGAVRAPDGAVRPPAATSRRWELPLSTSPVPALHRGAMLLRREAWERVGPLQTNLRSGAFASWYARAVAAGVTMQMIPDVIYERRARPAASTLMRATSPR